MMINNSVEPRGNKAEIIAKILEVAQGPFAMAGLEDGWNIPRLTSTQIRDSLQFTLKNGLLAYAWKDGAYKTTQKGSDFVKSYRKMCNLFSFI